jgi:hypothetical protein
MLVIARLAHQHPLVQQLEPQQIGCDPFDQDALTGTTDVVGTAEVPCFWGEWQGDLV